MTESKQDKIFSIHDDKAMLWDALPPEEIGKVYLALRHYSKTGEIVEMENPMSNAVLLNTITSYDVLYEQRNKKRKAREMSEVVSEDLSQSDSYSEKSCPETLGAVGHQKMHENCTKFAQKNAKNCEKNCENFVHEDAKSVQNFVHEDAKSVQNFVTNREQRSEIRDQETEIRSTETREQIPESSAPNDSKKRNRSVLKDEKNEPKIVFSFAESTFKNITGEDKQLWQEAYPAVDIDSNIKRAALWLKANPGKRKTNYLRFLTNWFAKTQEKGGDIPSNPVRASPQQQQKVKSSGFTKDYYYEG